MKDNKFNNIELPRTVYVENILAPYVKTFLQERFNDVNALNDSIHDSNWDQIRKVGHKLQGTSGSYGFNELGECGRIIEEIAINSKDINVVSTLTQKMEEHLRNVQIIFVEEKD